MDAQHGPDEGVSSRRAACPGPMGGPSSPVTALDTGSVPCGHDAGPLGGCGQMCSAHIHQLMGKMSA